jgi:hypothetical protein
MGPPHHPNEWNVGGWFGVLAFCVAFRSYGGASDGA